MARSKQKIMQKQIANKQRALFRAGDFVRLTYGATGRIVDAAAGPDSFNIKHEDGRVVRYNTTQFKRAEPNMS